MIPIVSVHEMALELGVSEQQIRTKLRDGEIQGELKGKQWIVGLKHFKAYKRKCLNLPIKDQIRTSIATTKIKALSFFSGAMGLDLGLEKSGIQTILACEFDKASRQTIIANNPDIGLIGDIWNYSAKEIKEYAGLEPDEEIDVIVGGPPCQAFSTAGLRKGFDDKRGNAFLRFLDLIIELSPKYAVIENVRGLLSAPIKHTPHSNRDVEWNPSYDEKAGGALLHIINKLRDHGYSVSFNLYNSANFGVPQIRERIVLICTKSINKVPYLLPTHSQNGEYGLPKWCTIKDVFDGINNTDNVDFPESRLKYYRMLKAGQYWKHLPQDLQKEAMGNSYYSGGGKTGFLRRLDWNKPSCTLVTIPNMPATDICHPVENRPLSIQEYKRIQQFPDEWIVCGNLKDQYKQIGNAVPVGLGEAIGKALLNHIKNEIIQPPNGFKFSRYKNTDDVTWEKETLKILSKKTKNELNQKTIFDVIKVN